MKAVKGRSTQLWKGKRGEASLKHLLRLPEDRGHFTEVWNKNLEVVTQVKGRQEEEPSRHKEERWAHSRRSKLGLSGTRKAKVARPRVRWAVG